MSEARITGEVLIDVADARPSTGDLLYAAQRQRSRILLRTQQGVDADGRPFAPYSEAYAKRRAKAGRQTGRVDLLYSGRMLKAILARAGRRTGIYGDTAIGESQFPEPADHFALGIFGEEAERAEGHSGTSGRRKGMPLRRFFGTGRGDVEAIGAEVVDRIEQRTQKKYGR